MDEQARTQPITGWVAAQTGARGVARTQRLQRLWGGYGELLRVHLVGAPWPSVIVKWVTPPAGATADAGSRSHARKLRSYAVEARWYGEWAARCDPACRVPRCLAVDTTGGHTRLLLEDLDVAGFGHRPARLVPAAMHSALDWLAAFHAGFMGATPHGLWPEGSYWHLATRPDELRATADRELLAAAPLLDERLASAQHRTLVHGDAKVDNLCFLADASAVAAVDFQYVGGGCGMRDVAYLLGGCVPEAACARAVPPLLDHYFAVLQRALAQRGRMDGAAVEREWRALFPVAWADFARFLAGWSGGPESPGPYTRALLRAALSGR